MAIVNIGTALMYLSLFAFIKRTLPFLLHRHWKFHLIIFLLAILELMSFSVVNSIFHAAAVGVVGILYPGMDVHSSADAATYSYSNTGGHIGGTRSAAGPGATSTRNSGLRKSASVEAQLSIILQAFNGSMEYVHFTMTHTAVMGCVLFTAVALLAFRTLAFVKVVFLPYLRNADLLRGKDGSSLLKLQRKGIVIT